VATSSGSPSTGPDAPGNDNVAGLRRIQLGGRVQRQSAAAADHWTRPFGGHQLHHQVAPDRVGARYQYLERCDDIERVEPVEQHDLRMHAVMFGAASTKD